MNMIDMLITSVVDKITSTQSKEEALQLVDSDNNIQTKKRKAMNLSDLEKVIIDKYYDELKDKPVKEIIRSVIRIVFVEISEALERGESVSIYKFGRFYPKFVKGREGINNITKERFKSEDKYVPKFEPSDVLKEKVARIKTNEDAKE